MKQYFDWKGWPFEYERRVNTPTWVLFPGKQSEESAVLNSISMTLSNADASNFPHYLDLEKKIDTLNLDLSWQREIRNFLGRYGIRTDHVEAKSS